MTGNELVHNPAARPNELIFGMLAELSQLGQIDFMTSRLQQGVTDGDFHRRRRAQPSALRYIARNDEVGPAEPASGARKHLRNSNYIVAPLACTSRWQVIQ